MTSSSIYTKEVNGLKIKLRLEIEHKDYLSWAKVHDNEDALIKILGYERPMGRHDD